MPVIRLTVAVKAKDIESNPEKLSQVDPSPVAVSEGKPSLFWQCALEADRVQSISITNVFFVVKFSKALNYGTFMQRVSIRPNPPSQDQREIRPGLLRSPSVGPSPKHDRICLVQHLYMSRIICSQFEISLVQQRC
ncbi:hypothetical protein GQ44DRAFT_734345 [Phaeosphaeriaceae sp. PMI808]|nr:hypothetical protein GQ44DRAFT_734345 [Phaeosphaeriaceae sp. PMI808]